MREMDLFIDGRWVPGDSGERLAVSDPATGERLATVAAATPSDVERAIAAASEAYRDGRWSRIPPGERARVLLKVADLIEERLETIARIESRDAGKPIKLTRNFDVPFGADNVRFFAGAARLLEGKAAGEYSPDHLSYLRRDPLGVIAAICPWNYTPSRSRSGRSSRRWRRVFLSWLSRPPRPPCRPSSSRSSAPRPASRRAC
jgi:acyl-CoA reductase-like NAD-dependent aldehyde dehydrogenase